MFVAGSNCIFTDEYLSQLRPKKPIEIINLSHMCKLKMYKLLDPGDFYLVGVDTAKSITGDFAAVEIYQYSNFEQVGEFVSRVGSLTKFSEVVKDIIDYIYKIIGKRILIGVENNSIGTAIVESLENDTKFDYMSLMYKEDSKRNSSVEKPYGITTTAKSKDKMISLYYDYITADHTLLHSGELIAQLSIIEKNSMGSVAAQKGQHDDLFMASCFCALLKKDRQFEIEPLINTNMKTYLKEQEELIQNIINIDNKNKEIDFSKYFEGAEVSKNIFPTEKEDNELSDLSNIPFPEFF